MVKTENNNVMLNAKSILLSALSLSVALGFNDLITSIFSIFQNQQYIISQATYVLIMFGITIFIAQYFSS